MHNEFFEKGLSALGTWFDSEENERYVVCAGLAVLEIMREKFPVEESDYITEGSQVKTSGPLIKKILARYGEKRKYAAEGGRTTRGTRPAAERFATTMNAALMGLERLSADNRAKIIDGLQGWLVEKVKDYFNRKRIEVDIVLSKPSYLIIADILTAANERKLAGAVAQHLVGAKLALRFPDLDIENHSYTTADAQLGRPGDFLINDTAIHVTMAPMPPVFGKCQTNVRQGYRSVLLVPESKTAAAKQMADGFELTNALAIFSIENFVGQNIDEIAGFGKTSFSQGMVSLMRKYNERVAAVETDLSMQIEIPENI